MRKPLVVVPRTEGHAARDVAKRSERHELRRNVSKGSAVPRKKYEHAAAAGELFVDVNVKQILRKATRKGRNNFDVFKVKEEGEQPVAKEWIWDDWRRQRKSQAEKVWKETRGLEEEHKRCDAFVDAPKRMMKYLEDSEDVNVGLGELKEQLETPEESCISFMQIAKQARKEGGQNLFQIFRQEEN